MRDYPERIAKFSGDRPKGTNEFQAVAATPTLHARAGVAMPRHIEGDHVKSSLDQGPDEAAELTTPAAPAVHQVDRMSLAPGVHRDASARDVDHRTNAGATRSSTANAARNAAIFKRVRTIVLFRSWTAVGLMIDPYGRVFGGRSGRPAGLAQQGCERPPGASFGVTGVDQLQPVIGDEHDSVEIVSELHRVEIGFELALGDGGPDDLGDGVVEIAVTLDNSIMHGAGLFFELGERLDEEASARLSTQHAVQPILEQGQHPWFTARPQDRGL